MPKSPLRTPLRLSQTAARTIMLQAMGLSNRSSQPSKNDVLTTIQAMGALQIDTINVVARSPYLVLWSRLGNYDPRWLDELLQDGAIFEYWAHEACFLPIEDYPLHRHAMIDTESRGWRSSHEWLKARQREAERMLDIIRKRGPVRAADFARTDGKSGGWWDWKPEKQMLERLFNAGELMIARRHNFQRIYDLRERVLPDWDDRQLPPLHTAHRVLVLKAIRALGITTERWVADYYRMHRKRSKPIVEALAADGTIREVTVEGLNEPLYVHRDNLPLAEAAARGDIVPELTTLLSPFDPLVWDRKRVETLFDFSYRIECYTPGPKRIYGYFTLPILSRGEIVGRLDAKAHRGEGRFEIKSLHMEPGARLTDQLASDLASALHECAAWHNTPQIDLRWTNAGSSFERKLRRSV